MRLACISHPLAVDAEFDYLAADAVEGSDDEEGGSAAEVSGLPIMLGKSSTSSTGPLFSGHLAGAVASVNRACVGGLHPPSSPPLKVAFYRGLGFYTLTP